MTSYVHQESETVSDFAIAISSFSLFCCVLQFIFIATFKRAREMFGTVIILRVMSDATFCVSLILEHAWPDYISCSNLAFVNVYTNLLSNLMVLGICFNMYTAIRNPFQPDRHKQNFMLAALAISLLIPSIAKAANRLGDSDLGFCWIHETINNDPWKWTMTYLPLIVCMAVSVYMLRYVEIKLLGTQNLRKHTATRFVRHGKNYLYFWILFWFCIMIMRIICQQYQGQTSTEIFLLTYASYGFWGLVIWGGINKIPKRIMKIDVASDDDDQKLSDEITRQMRLELVYLTTAGIREAALLNADKSKGYPGEALEQKMLLHLYGQPIYQMKVRLENIDLMANETEYRKGLKDLYIQSVDKVFETVGNVVDRVQHVVTGDEGKVDESRKFEDERCLDKAFNVLEATFFDFAPEEFTSLRNHLGISVADYINSFKDQRQSSDDAGMKEMGSTGKSGSVFYFTIDKKYIIKSVADHEMDTILSVVHDLCAHTRNHQDTTIHYYGAHAIQLPSTSEQMYFVVMKNLLYEAHITINEIYTVKQFDNWDLKGALFLRQHVDKEDLVEKHIDKTKKVSAPLDLDWMDLHRRVYAPPEDLKNMTQILKTDCDFLGRKNMLDYSLLLGVYNCKANEPGAKELDEEGGPLTDDRGKPLTCQLYRRGHLQDDQENLYLMGIIDITERSRLKWIIQGPILRCLLKCCLHPFKRTKDTHPDAITAVDPKTYADRFVEFMEKIVLRTPVYEGETPISEIPGPFSLYQDYDLEHPDTMPAAEDKSLLSAVDVRISDPAILSDASELRPAAGVDSQRRSTATEGEDVCATIESRMNSSCSSAGFVTGTAGTAI